MCIVDMLTYHWLFVDYSNQSWFERIARYGHKLVV